MSELFRDTLFGHVLRYLSHQRLFPHEEDKDPSVWQKYVHQEKTARMATHGHTGEVDEEKETESNGEAGDANTASSESADTGGSQSGTQNEVTGVRVDPEKGKDVNIVDWFGPEDPEVIYFSKKIKKNKK